MGFRKLLLGSLALTSIVSVADRAAAQEAESGSAFGDIVVTAQKRDESLQDVPVSVSAYTAEFREQTGIISTQDQMNFTPGVVFSQTADRVSIRGVGRQTNVTGTDPGVAVYNDGFYQPGLSEVGGSTLGTARIEVLRGPQGTLYGRNSIGGAINVISVRPSDEFEGEVRLGYNDFGRTTVEGRVSGPLSDNSRGSLQVLKIDQEDGYYDNLMPGMPDEGGVTDSWAIEGQWAVDVTDRFDMWFRLRASNADNRDRSSSLISQYDYGYSLENVPTPTYDLRPGGSNPLSNPGIDDPRTFYSDRARENYVDNAYLFVTEMNYRFDDFNVRYVGGWQQYDSGYSVDGEQGPSVGFDWELSDDWYNYAFFPYSPLSDPRDIGSGGGYLYLDDLELGQASGVTIPVTGDVRTWGTDDKDVFSHEINLTSTHDGPLQWLLGAYYYQEQYVQNFHISFPSESVFDNVLPASFSPLGLLLGADLVGDPGTDVDCSGLPVDLGYDGLGHCPVFPPELFYGITYAASLGSFNGLATPNPDRDGFATFGALETRSSGIFSQFDYDFSDTLHGTFGIRYSHDEKNGLERERIPGWHPFLIPAGTTISLDITGDGVPDLPVSPLVGLGNGQDLLDADGNPGTDGVDDHADLLADRIVNYTAELGANTGQLGRKNDSWNHISGTAGLQWTPNDDMMFYASYSHGYKSGGFTLGPFKPAVDPETIDAIEVGWKLELSPTLQFNGALFHYNYHGLQTIIQTPTIGGATSQLINLDEARTMGVELEALWAPTENLRIMANYSYNDAEILRACCFLDDSEPELGDGDSQNDPQDIGGNRVPLSPEHKAALNATYSFFMEPGELSFSATVNYRSESYYSVFNTDNWLMDGYTTTDFRVRWVDSEDRYAIIGTVANAFDEDAVQSFSTTNPQTSSQQSVGLQPPRIYSVEFQYRF